MGEQAPTEAEVELWRGLRAGYPHARKALFDSYAPLARRLARRHHMDRSRGDIEFADLQQLAFAGLLESIDRYNPDFGTPFQSYAQPRIVGSILDGLNKISETREQLSFRRRMVRERGQSLGARGVDQMGATEAFEALVDAAVGLAIGFMLEGTSLYASSETPAQSGTAYDTLVWKEAVVRVLHEVDALPERERYIIKSHYIGGLSFEHIAQVLSLSRGRVAQIHRDALTRIRKRLGKTSFEFRE